LKLLNYKAVFFGGCIFLECRLRRTNRWCRPKKQGGTAQPLNGIEDLLSIPFKIIGDSTEIETIAGGRFSADRNSLSAILSLLTILLVKDFG